MGPTARLLQGATLPIRPKEETAEWADKSPDITRSCLAGKWSEADMVKLLMTSGNPNGPKPTPPMPVFYLNREHGLAVAWYLRSLPDKKRGHRPAASGTTDRGGRRYRREPR